MSIDRKVTQYHDHEVLSTQHHHQVIVVLLWKVKVDIRACIATSSE